MFALDEFTEIEYYEIKKNMENPKLSLFQPE